jgi:parallel beta-helix repeat protein
MTALEDTAMLQGILNAAPIGGTATFPPGMYAIDATRGLRPHDGTTVVMDGVTLGMENIAGQRNIIFDMGLVNREGRRRITLKGGTLIGQRAPVTTSLTSGWGIFASDAEDLAIEGTVLRDFYIDGIILTGNFGCKRVAVRGVWVNNCRRNGMAIIAGNDITVEDSSFLYTNGTSPQAGLDVEPNAGDPAPGSEVHNLRILRSTFKGCSGHGLYVQQGKGRATTDVYVAYNTIEDNKGAGLNLANVARATVANNTFARNSGRIYVASIHVGQSPGVVITRNSVTETYRGIAVYNCKDGAVVGNTVEGTGIIAGVDGRTGCGIYINCAVMQDGILVTGNTITRSSGAGIELTNQKGRLASNRIDSVGQRGIYTLTTTEMLIDSNVISNVGLDIRQKFDGIELQGTTYSTIRDNLFLQPRGPMRVNVNMGGSTSCTATRNVNVT